jgi:hypothetical protein
MKDMETQRAAGWVLQLARTFIIQVQIARLKANIRFLRWLHRL